MNTLLYLSYGKGLHELEVIYSVHSARHCSKNCPDLRIVIYTDNPDSFSSVPANVEFISTKQWSEWGGPHMFNHRRKILSLQHAIRNLESPVILVDGDTWWRDSPEKLFRRIRPGATVMHIREGSIAEIQGKRIQDLRSLVRNYQFQFLNGSSAYIPGDCQMWNAGVIGLHPDDGSILDEVINLTDQFCDHAELHVLEQFAFSFLLASRTTLAEANDLVFHYWPSYLHAPFRQVLPTVIEEAGKLDPAKKAAFLYRWRPRPSVMRRGKVIVKRIAQWCGFLQGQSRSNEW
jgi:hypothetical protein